MSSLQFLKKASVYTLMEAATLVILVLSSWGFGERTEEAIAGTFFFVGLCALMGALILSDLSRRPS